MLVRLLLTAILATTLATAQGKKGGGTSNNMGDIPRARTLSKFELFAEKLKLNKEQKDDALNALNAAMEESAPVREQMDKSRVAVGAALIDGKTGDELKKLTDDVTSASAQLIVVEAKAFSKIYASLKPNQQAKAGQAFELLAETIDRPGGGRSGGGGRKKQ
jgi:hypothetical protein